MTVEIAIVDFLVSVSKPLLCCVVPYSVVACSRVRYGGVAETSFIVIDKPIAVLCCVVPYRWVGYGVVMYSVVL